MLAWHTQIQPHSTGYGQHFITAVIQKASTQVSAYIYSWYNQAMRPSLQFECMPPDTTIPTTPGSYYTTAIVLQLDDYFLFATCRNMLWLDIYFWHTVLQ